MRRVAVVGVGETRFSGPQEKTEVELFSEAAMDPYNELKKGSLKEVQGYRFGLLGMHNPEINPPWRGHRNWQFYVCLHYVCSGQVKTDS